MKIACIAKAANEGRCRDDKVKNRRCEAHQEAEEVLQPNDLLVKYELDKKLTDRARELGIRFVERTWVKQIEIENANKNEAEARGVDFYAYRDKTGDSGTSVFNGREGLKIATSGGLLGELMVAGFEITDIHVLQRPKDQPLGKGFLLVGYQRGRSVENQFQPPPDKEEAILDFITEGSNHTWSRITVFENPPRGDLVRHTVNHLGFATMSRPTCRLKFGDGHWEAEELGLGNKILILAEYSSRTYRT